MVFYDSSWQDRPYTARSLISYMVFYQGGPIDNCTHVLGQVDLYSTGSEYNVACTEVMALENFRMLNTELLNKDTYVVR